MFLKVPIQRWVYYAQRECFTFASRGSAQWKVYKGPEAQIILWFHKSSDIVCLSFKVSTSEEKEWHAISLFKSGDQALTDQALNELGIKIIIKKKRQHRMCNNVMAQWRRISLENLWNRLVCFKNNCN